VPLEWPKRDLATTSMRQHNCPTRARISLMFDLEPTLIMESGITVTAKEMGCATLKEREQMAATRPRAITILVRSDQTALGLDLATG
jgi:hypothetical protein